MSDTIDKVVMNAVSQISDLPGVLSNVVKNKHFITVINETGNMCGQRVSYQIVIIDFKTKIMYDLDEFYNHSNKIYKKMLSIGEWYRC